MKKDFFELYDALLSGIYSDEHVVSARTGRSWAMAEIEGSCGIAMAERAGGIAPMYAQGLDGMELTAAASAVKSWNFAEAALALAAMNAYYNTAGRIAALHAEEEYEHFCTAGLDISGKTLGFVGHLKCPDFVKEQAKQIYILEREPKPGDYPDSACDYILPMCDIVLITGSSLINKTLPHLLSVCRGSYNILVGPSVPLAPVLFDFGLDRISGMAVTDMPGMRAHIRQGMQGSPYGYGQPFTLCRQA